MWLYSGLIWCTSAYAHGLSIGSLGMHGHHSHEKYGKLWWESAHAAFLGTRALEQISWDELWYVLVLTVEGWYICGGVLGEIPHDREVCLGQFQD